MLHDYCRWKTSGEGRERVLRSARKQRDRLGMRQSTSREIANCLV